MVRITEELIVKRSEHNDGILHTLREITLHQFEIEKIELLGKVCRHLEILYLQNNLISKIENLYRMKELQYLNLALNNITCIEGLDRCESLRKLDLTVNFIDCDKFEESLLHLQKVPSIREIYLLGNPCTSFEDFRLLIAHMVPQLERVDSEPLTEEERDRGRQQYPELIERLREKAKEVAAVKSRKRESDEPINTSEHSPEARLKYYREQEEQKRREEEEAKANCKFQTPEDPIEEIEKKLSEPATMGDDGELPKQRNTSRIEFTLEEEEESGRVRAVLDVPRYMETSLLDVQIHPLWFQVIWQPYKTILLHVPREVSPDSSRVRRIISTGQLEILMPFSNFTPKP